MSKMETKAVNYRQRNMQLKCHSDKASISDTENEPMIEKPHK